jgi:hypothetical protein
LAEKMGMDLEFEVQNELRILNSKGGFCLKFRLFSFLFD